MTAWKNYVFAAAIAITTVIARYGFPPGSVSADFRDAPREISALDSLNSLNPARNGLAAPAPATPVKEGLDPAEFARRIYGGRGSDAPQDADKWYGADSNRARMKFSSAMLYELPAGYTGSDADVNRMVETVRFQLRHMFGAFTTHPYFKNNPGIPSGDYKITWLKVEKIPGTNCLGIHYSYENVVVFAKSLFNGGGPQKISFVLPKDPLRIYSRSYSKSLNKNPCTDKHYNNEPDFWYFWNPYQEGCSIAKGDLVTVQAELQPIGSTRETYPEYRRLRGDNGNDDVLKVTYLVGVNEKISDDDAGKKNFDDAVAGLRKAGFETIIDEPFYKKFSRRNAGYTAFIYVFLVDFHQDQLKFLQVAVNGLETSDVFLYNGHSGLGGNLSLANLAWGKGNKPLVLPTGKYQIFYFHGCSTYAYYNESFFNLKRTPDDPKGTKQLDIITTGVGSMFKGGAGVDLAFLTSIATDQRPSWQTIINKMHAAEGASSALTHVNGDEDNPQTP